MAMGSGGAARFCTATRPRTTIARAAGGILGIDEPEVVREGVAGPPPVLTCDHAAVIIRRIKLKTRAWRVFRNIYSSSQMQCLKQKATGLLALHEIVRLRQLLAEKSS